MIMEKEKLVSLVSAAQNGDNDAMNELFNAFYNDFYYFALKTVKNDELALDITQETFVEIINTLGNLKEPAAFVTWAKQITYHQCTRYFKKKKDVLVDEDEDGNTIFDTLKEDKAEFVPDEALDKADFKKTVMAILDELSEEQRSAVMMYYFDEMSVRQIAEIQGVSEGTVKSRLNYARKAIKNSVEEYEKKHNIKLHAIPFFPFFKWIFEGAFEGGMPVTSAEIVAEGITTATGTAITVSATGTTATAVGIGAKIAAMPLITKIIAGIVAAAIVVGGTVTAVLLSDDNKDDLPTGNQSIVSTGNDETTSTGSDNDASDTNSSDTDSTTETHTHTWGNWSTETEAFIGKNGTQIRTCSSCKAVERKSVQCGAEVFEDTSIARLLNHTIDYQYVNVRRGKYELDAEGLLGYAANSGGQLEDHSSSGVFEYLSQRFTLTDTLKTQMKAHEYYDASTDSFNLEYFGEAANITPMKYVHNGGNKYIVTFNYSRFEWNGEYGLTIKVEVEYNAPQGRPNRYLSFVIQ